MTKKEFIEKYHTKTEFNTKVESERTLNTLLETIQECLVEGNDVAFIGWGTFEVAERVERTGRNPKTGETMTIPAKKVVKFKVGSKLKEAVQVKVKKGKKNKVKAI